MEGRGTHYLAIASQTDQQAAHETRMAVLETKMGEMAQRVDTLAGRGDAFIVVVEKYISGNGRTKSKRRR